MTNIQFDDGTIIIDPAMLARDLRIVVSTVRRLRLIVDNAGSIVQHSKIDFGDIAHSLRAIVHKPSA